MKIVLQRVKNASVSVDDRVVGSINKGVCLLVGIEKGDLESQADYLAKKIIELRIFPDPDDRMNLSLLDIHGEVLAISQFTLAGSIKKGRRPSFDKAEEPDRAQALFDYFVDRIKESGVKVATGQFAAMMKVSLVNDGPVTFVLNAPNL